MVAGHTEIPEGPLKFIYAFHMPLFFFVSGIFYNKGNLSFKDFLIKKVKTLVIPYFFFTLLALCLMPWKMPFLHVLVYGWDGENFYTLWFIPVLFVSELIFFLFSGHKRVFILSLAIICSIATYYLSKSHIDLPYNFNIVPLALFYISLGYAAAPFIILMKIPGWRTFLYGLILFVFSSLLPRLDMYNNEPGVFPMNLLNSLLGILFTFAISQRLNRFTNTSIIKAIRFFGINSLFVMAFSPLFQTYCYSVTHGIGKLTRIPIPNDSLPSIIFRVILPLILVYFTTIFCRRFLPFTIGVYGNKKGATS